MKSLQEKRNFRKRAIFLIMVYSLLLVLSLSLFAISWSSVAHNLQGSSISTLDWAGYTIAKNSLSPQAGVTAISGSWIVPEVKVSAGEGYSSAWIGIGGELDQNLIQVGTEQNAIDGQATYYAWYEFLPITELRISDLTLSPGDAIVASVSLINSSTNTWGIRISDITTGQFFSTNIVYNSSRDSGEWIVERPTINNQLSNLTDFGKVTFTNCNVQVNNVAGAIGKFLCSKLQMTNSQNADLASVSAFTENRLSFTVTYLSSH